MMWHRLLETLLRTLRINGFNLCPLEEIPDSKAKDDLIEIAKGPSLAPLSIFILKVAH
jgi:hypothetical protein